MSSVLVSPYAEAMSVAETKVHLKMESSVLEDDDLISGLLASSRSLIEVRSGQNLCRQRAIMATTFQKKLDYFPSCTIKLDHSPLLSVVSIQYVDSAGDTQTLSASNYVVDRAGCKIDLAYGGTWPSTRYQPNAVTVTFISGLAATFTGAASDTCTIFGRTLADGDRVRLLNSGGSLPPPLQPITDYFVRDWNAGDGTFKLAATSGGSAVDITGTGSGIHYVTEFPQDFGAIKDAMKLTLAHLYYNRQSVAVMPGLAAIEIPWSASALIAAVGA